ncbi:microtubule binding protein [Striga asiatica]|uniref:Microtubule binding protein n=1 Tax=Striga asiatica TaxID=4170 RepID=A0A5A7RCG7_STRAF|nr:microtubule binding protein [Striga asiatica]
MVARTPPKQPRKKMAAIAPHLSPTLLRETVRKVDKCMSRLQELQHTVTGGSKVISSPLRSSYRTNVPAFKQDLSRIRNANNNPRRSPPGKLPPVKTEDWRKMSLPAMLLGETMSELVQATQFARNIVVQAAATLPSKIRKSSDDPKTPPLEKKKPIRNMNLEDTWQKMQARRKREKKKQTVVWPGPGGTSPRAKSKINFKECDKENCRYVIEANRVSPRNRPWARKTVLFPNPIFHSSLSPTREKVPVIARSIRQTPHKFLIKSPPLKSANRLMIISPLKGRKNGENMMMMKEIEKSREIAHKFLMKGKTKNESADGLGKKLSPPPAKLRRSFSPSRLAKRIVLSPMKFRSSMQKNGGSTNI